ncbi:metal-sulfur cluster assembly factor [Mucilaginibacter boryungensis]|uniref:Metal-sulfur cluster assembly factor n=1 Tax=Mucilaginibacter boryungensis TaxID=768480 RepID=A0ABR9XE43_9SPHI|nr:metal-sulfur cluster assembly factor [Mucilaginibacter boryungensis]MBE9665350.1 metal-sulfur cluster assembly factor [Mucilaginibacter boryungensis]
MASFDITDPLSFLKAEIMETLRLVIDPELHINIIDLGLVYGIAIDADNRAVLVTMTLSSAYCPMGESIISAVKNCIEGHYTGYTAEVVLVWQPVWSYDSISEEGKRLLGL